MAVVQDRASGAASGAARGRSGSAGDAAAGAVKDPHDAQFRREFAKPASAASLVRSALPAEIVARLDVDGVRVVPGTFVDEEFQRLHTDLTLSVPASGGGGDAVLVYVVVEHQSSPDPMMSFRMLQYVVRVWGRHLRQHRRARGLPAVIPLVVHAGRRTWSGPVQVAELIDDQVVPRDSGFVPRFRFLLEDLAVLDVEALLARPLVPSARLTLLVLARAPGNQQLVQELRGWAADVLALLDQPGGVAEFRMLLRYIWEVGDTSLTELGEVLTQWGSRAEEAYMSTADMLRAEGEARGRAEGEAQGEARGRADLLLKQLTLKFGPLTPGALDRVHTASTDELDRWAERILTANTLDEVLR
jgi:predicted transposase/invertase (TIGR01784 family)